MLAEVFDMGRGMGGDGHWWVSQDYLCPHCGRDWQFIQDSEAGCAFAQHAGPRDKIADRFWWQIGGKLMYGANIWGEVEVIDVPVNVFSEKILERKVYAGG